MIESCGNDEEKMLLQWVDLWPLCECCSSFLPRRKKFYLFYNVPGTVQNSMVAIVRSIYDKLENVFKFCGGCCIVDFAFAHSSYPFLITSEKWPVDMVLDEMNLVKKAKSMHQSAEWGMWASQSSFPQVKDCIEFESIWQQKLMMKVIIHSYNFTTKKVGINQICNVYMPSLIVDGNQMFA